jgi:glucan phosphorylase
VIPGIGGVRILRALGYRDIGTFHLNEGHAALLTLALLDEAAKKAGRESIIAQDRDAVRNRCVFTTHTPVPAGHDKFSLELAWKVIGEPVHGKGEERDHAQDAPSLYDKLEQAVVPLFYHDRVRFMDMMAYSIAINGSFFNTQRMVQEYVLNAYFNR